MNDVRSDVYIIKLAGACNLNCSYCYVYNLGDTTFKKRSKRMSKKAAVAALTCIYDYARKEELRRIKFVLHGGEPLLVGKEWMKWFLDQAYGRLPLDTLLEVGVQTNGTLVDDEWLALFSRYRVGIGISMDGLPEAHNRYRVDFGGRGSYEKVKRAIELLCETSGQVPLDWGVLVVANPEYSGVDTYQHLLDLGVRHMDFLWPDHHHDAPPPWPSGTLAKYYMGIFDTWYGADDPNVEVRFFTSIIRALMGRKTGIDALGPNALTEVVVESDGSLEPLDVLRVCQNGMTQIGLNVVDHDIDTLRENPLFLEGINNQSLLPAMCHECPAYNVCGGGYMPHRWGNDQRFQNNSVYCDDLLEIITHVYNDVRSDIKRAQSQTAAA